MLPRLLHQSISLLLASLYLVVGLTGSSAHYMAEPLSSVGEGKGAGRTAGPAHGGYYHCHGPDYHWHFHPHEHEDDVQEATGETPAADSGTTTGFRAARLTPHAHACPLLGLVAGLKVALLVRGDLLADGGTQRGLIPLVSDALAEPLSRLHLARGPPGANCLPLSG